MIAAVVIGLSLSRVAVAGEAPASTSHGGACACPERSPGWTLYPDSARIPDFFQESSIQVHGVLLRERGVHIFFQAKQAGEGRETCLVISEPTLEYFLDQLPPDSIPSDDDLEQIVNRLDWESSNLRERLKTLRDILGQPTNGSGRVSFKTGWLRNAPKLYPGSPIRFQWDEQSVDLVGLMNVYFREQEM